MEILIIGGARFQGRLLIHELLSRGHSVTVFHRGTHSLEPCPELTDILGDRNLPEDMSKLSHRTFDCCVDTCAYFPEQIELARKFVTTDHYCLISSVYAYAKSETLVNEKSPLHSAPRDSIKSITQDNYGALKALCENAALTHFGGGCLILRPSVIIGPQDHTERLMFWMRLVNVHGKIIEFFNHQPILQPVDVRDLTSFTAHCVTKKQQGAINICGKSIELSFLLDMIEKKSKKKCQRKLINYDALASLGLSNLPYCEGINLSKYDTKYSYSLGFGSRSLEDSLDEIFNFFSKQGFSMDKFQSEEVAILKLFM